MSMVAKILVVLNLILAVAVMGAAGAYVNSAENKSAEFTAAEAKWETERTELKNSIQKADAAATAANERANAASKEQARAEEQAKTLVDAHNRLDKQIESQGNSLKELNASLNNMRAQLESANARNESLQRDKEAAEAARRDALSAQSAAETEQKRLESEVANLTATLEGVRTDLHSIRIDLESTATELATYKAKYAPPTETGVPAKGVVLAADNKMDIYMISVGEKDGVKVNDTLTVYRGGAFVAEVVVDQVFGDKAAVYVKKMGGTPLKKGDIKQGDQVSNIL